MAEKPSLTIVTITYNDPVGFRRTASSVVSQTCKDIEWIVKDGGSDDATLSSVRESMSKCQFRHRLVSGIDNGVYDAMNKSFRLASGNWLLFLNGGDELASPHVVDDLLRHIVSEGVSPCGLYIIAGSTLFVNQKGRISVKPPRGLEECTGINSYRMSSFHQSQVYSFKLYSTQSFRLNLPVSADHAFFWDAIRNGSSVSLYSRVVSRFYSGGVSSKKWMRSCIDVGFSIFKIQDQSPLLGVMALLKRIIASLFL